MGQAHLITKIHKGSIAEELEIEAGDSLLAVNDEEIEDVLDYRYLLNDEYIEVLIKKQDGEEWLLEIEKNYEDDLGIEFESGLMSGMRSCTNKCVFCFIDQMPPGMRQTLYFKDDDSRLSFLQGNYITLTNMEEKDINRILRLRLAPINISVQTTNPALRCEMLNNRFAGGKLKFLDSLYEGKVEMNGQIVLCKGLNDREELERSIADLSKYIPFMRSVSVVPAGITKYREGLYRLENFDRQEAISLIETVERWQEALYENYGLHFIHASDEWYILAGKDFPEAERYDGYLQLENGVGMMRIFTDGFREALEREKRSGRYKEKKKGISGTVTIATGKLAYDAIKAAAGEIMENFPNKRINVCCIKNEFFGETITVSGLITGQDLIGQLRQKQENGVLLGGILFIPSNMLRAGEEVFLDDYSVADVEKALCVKVRAVEADGQKFLDAILAE